MKTFYVPQSSDVSAPNKAIFDKLSNAIGMVPNLYAYFAKHETALSDYLTLQNRKSTLKTKEREVINLVVSEVNGCRYCQSAHTVMGKLNGFTEEQILQIRSGTVPFDPRLDALAKFVKEITSKRGKPSLGVTNALFNAGYDESNMIDIIIVIGDKVISNFLYGVTQFPIDFPLATELTSEDV